jgi:antitoxin (DNA-binding transcriptional repressor) of toxin-antitoxin stability system
MKTDSEVRSIGAGEFKAKCLQLMDYVNEKKITLVITKRGVAVAQLSPAPAAEKPKPAAKPATTVVSAVAAEATDKKSKKHGKKGKKKK